MEPTQHPLGVAAVESVVRSRAWRGHLLVTLLWAGVLGVSTRVELGHAALTVAVAVHVMGLVIGLGDSSWWTGTGWSGWPGFARFPIVCGWRRRPIH